VERTNNRLARRTHSTLLNSERQCGSRPTGNATSIAPLSRPATLYSSHDSTASISSRATLTNTMTPTCGAASNPTAGSAGRRARGGAEGVKYLSDSDEKDDRVFGSSLCEPLFFQ